jgi:arginase
VASSDLLLLVPEWQGYGLDSSVAAGARAAAGLFGAAGFVEIDTPREEALTVEEGVLGLASIAARLQQTLAAISTRQPSRILTLGGTCGAELAPVSYLNAHYRGDLAVVWLDAHADLNTPESSPSGRFHGMVLRTLLGAGPLVLVNPLPRRLAPNQIVLAGARDLDRDEVTFVSNASISLLAPADAIVPDRVTGRIRSAGFSRVYVHLDLDVLDPVEFPDVLVPAPGGLSAENVAALVRDLATRFEMVGFSVVEFRPRSADALKRLAYLLERAGIDIGFDLTRPSSGRSG